MELTNKFTKEYSQQVVKAQEAKIKDLRDDLRNRLQSKDEIIKSKAEKEFKKMIQPTKVPLDLDINLFLINETFSVLLFKGKVNQAGKDFQHEFLTKFIRNHSQINIEFKSSKNNIKPSVVFKGIDVYYLLYNKMNSYSTKFAEKFKEKNLKNKSILLINGDIKSHAYKNFQDKIKNLDIMNIDQFVEWGEQN